MPVINENINHRYRYNIYIYYNISFIDMQIHNSIIR